jgi:glutamine amidotransferase
MCRYLAWLGAPRQLTELLLEPEDSLLVQSYAPRTGDGRRRGERAL